MASSPIEVGDRVELMPDYSPTTVNVYDRYDVADGDHVIDGWPILGRYGNDSAGAGWSR